MGLIGDNGPCSDLTDDKIDTQRHGSTDAGARVGTIIIGAPLLLASSENRGRSSDSSALLTSGLESSPSKSHAVVLRMDLY